MGGADIALGASIACSGCCLTVVNKDNGELAFDVSAESLSKTIIGAWDVGTQINLERSLKMGDEMGGHIVSGHVDALAVIESIEQEGDSHRVRIAVPEEFERYIAPKGSITLDGISLTVNEVQGCRFGINIIPHTWTHTTFGQRKAGDRMNMEIDMLARYVARQLGRDAA
jgi:riboflavin synthase